MNQQQHDEIAEYLGYDVHRETYEKPHGSQGTFCVSFYYMNGIQYHLDFVNWWPDITAAFRALGYKRMPTSKKNAAKELESIWQCRKDGTLIKDVVSVQHCK